MIVKADLTPNQQTIHVLPPYSRKHRVVIEEWCTQAKLFPAKLEEHQEMTECIPGMRQLALDKEKQDQETWLVPHLTDTSAGRERRQRAQTELRMD